MKKIGVLTFSNSYNYGAVLQSIALYDVLNKENSVMFIDYCNEYENSDHKLITYKNNLSLKQNLKNNISNILFMQHRYLTKSFKKFIESYNFTKKYNQNSINNIDEDYNFDYIILGSDQLWNPKIYGGNMDKIFLLDFNTKAKKMSYSTSLGSYNIEEKYEDLFNENLKSFYKISVREKYAKEQLNKIGVDDTFITCDPTMLLKKDEWLDKMQLENKHGDYILVYLIGPYKKYENQIKQIKDRFNLKVIYVTFSNKNRNYVDEYARGYNPLEFLNLIYNAKYVLTNSFHGTVFSLIFNKEFYHLENADNPIRVRELLENVSLQERIITSNDDINKKISEINLINYDIINKVLESIRVKNINWLFDSIK